MIRRLGQSSANDTDLPNTSDKKTWAGVPPMINRTPDLRHVSQKNQLKAIRDTLKAPN